MKNLKVTTILVLSLFTLILNSCSSNNNDLEDAPEVINLEDVKISDFPLFGITPISIEIIAPTIVNNKETKFGEINIVIPYTVSLNGIASSITSNELNLSKFNIFPGNNTMLNFETQTHIYKIINVFDESEELLHYSVNIKKETAPVLSTLTISSFKFEATKNAQLTEDVIIEHRFENGNRRDIYLFVPEGTNFSNLTPTATFDAEEVFFTQNSSIPVIDIDTPFPTVDTNFDFSYPKSFYIVLRDNSSNRMKWVNVFVDVKNPVQLENTDITTPNITALGSSKYFNGITKWKNVGNHKIEFKSATTYENKVPDITGNIIKADRVLVAGGLAPGESANVNISVKGDLPMGEYKTTALFHTSFLGHNAVDDIVQPIKLNIISNLVN
ncbi:hypothetical protein [Tenacibaculum ovolyticum]|uniref:hypothetical protein n=1 Tax=Tenacibaculum ovolyticum TaxID=104270 RepID=UPI001F365DF0|nr:hypothetical protein [Tenacibaculum ovolyticum]